LEIELHSHFQETGLESNELLFESFVPTDSTAINESENWENTILFPEQEPEVIDIDTENDSEEESLDLKAVIDALKLLSKYCQRDFELCQPFLKFEETFEKVERKRLKQSKIISFFQKK
jgi:hypothetical protein